MKESFWGIFIITVGVIAITFVFLFQRLTNVDEHNSYTIKEVTEAAMIDALDIAAYRNSKTVRIDGEKFVENFVRRFAENANLSSTYSIEIYDINEEPPKVSLKVTSNETTGISGETVSFALGSKVDAILEMTY